MSDWYCNAHGIKDCECYEADLVKRIAELEAALHNITNMAHPLHMDIFNEAMKGLGLQEGEG